MKTRLLWIAIIALGLTALYCGIVQPVVTAIPSDVREPFADLKPPEPPAIEPPALVIPPTPTIQPPPLRPVSRLDPILGPPEVPIQDNATIDFSTGAPNVKRHGIDHEELQKAMREITEATKGASFEAKK